MQEQFFIGLNNLNNKKVITDKESKHLNDIFERKVKYHYIELVRTYYISRILYSNGNGFESIHKEEHEKAQELYNFMIKHFKQKEQKNETTIFKRT